MTQTIKDNLQVDGSLSLRDDLSAGGTLHAIGRPTAQDYIIDLCGSTPLSQPPTTYLKVNQQSVDMDNLPGINTVILHPNGTFKAKANHNVYQSATQWNSWADWLNTTATNEDVVAAASYGGPGLPYAPGGGSAMNLLAAIHAEIYFTTGPPGPRALLFVKGQARSAVAIGYPLPAPPYPPGSSAAAGLEVSYHRLLKPYCGNVGIGTSEPTSSLHVVGELRVRGEGHGVILSVQGGETELVGYFVVRGDPGGGTIAEFIGRDGKTKLLINESGNVGIGTSSPGSPLEISDGTSAISLNPGLWSGIGFNQ